MALTRTTDEVPAVLQLGVEQPLCEGLRRELGRLARAEVQALELIERLVDFARVVYVAQRRRKGFDGGFDNRQRLLPARRREHSLDHVKGLFDLRCVQTCAAVVDVARHLDGSAHRALDVIDVDGNGRTSRLLSTLCLYRAGYDFKRLFTISEYDRDRLAFYAALQRVREQGMDLTGWLDYFVAGLSTQLQEVKVRGEQAIRTDLVAREHKLNSRQALLVDAFIREKRLTLAGCELVLPGTNRRTLQRDLRGLVDGGLIREVGQATDPTRHYLWQEL